MSLRLAYVLGILSGLALAAAAFVLGTAIGAVE